MEAQALQCRDGTQIAVQEGVPRLFDHGNRSVTIDHLILGPGGKDDDDERE